VKRRRWFVIASGLAVVAAGCGSGADSGALRALDALAEPATTTTTTTTPPTSDAQRECEEQHLETKSFRPDPLPSPGAMPAGTYLEQIQARGKLRVGVDQTTQGFGYRDSAGNIEGFDVSIAREIARAIFGDPDKIELVPVTSGQRTGAVKRGDVDLVASLVTMTCSRWQDVLFSTEYYHAVQRVLVREDSEINELADLDGKKVCATSTSTSIAYIRQFVPGAIPYPVETRAECLVALQEGRTDAIATDDTILYGFQHQDPTTRLLPDRLEDEPYGIAISHDHPELVRFVNAVLDQIRADGTWTQLDQQLEAQIGLPATQPPDPQYRD
jgi:polar amino acid transport system substrate-binding protein